MATTCLVCLSLVPFAPAHADPVATPAHGSSAAPAPSQKKHMIRPGREEIEVHSRKLSSAIYQAPTSTPLSASQPTSVINRHFIENNVPATGNYDTVAAIAPSVMNIAPNGPGLGNGQGLSLRGFQDGQYNVLFDGIPFSDTNDNTHHTADYFMAHDLGDMQVDRGPGNAATTGFATFGGQILANTKAPSETRSGEIYGTAGSWNTYNYGGEFDSGRIKALNGGRFFVDAEQTQTRGYVTYAAMNRVNALTKYIQPLGTHTTLTAFAMYNTTDQHSAPGATRAQIAAYGPEYGFSNDPRKQNYEGYNIGQVQSDLEYIDLKSTPGDDWTIENKAYTYAYYHQPGKSGADVNGTQPNGTIYGKGNVPGTQMKNNYRDWGDIFKLGKKIALLDLSIGVWVDHSSNSRNQLKMDWTLQKATPATGLKAFTRLMHDQTMSEQPFIQSDWHLTQALTFSAGFKYAFFTRDLEAKINQKTKAPLNYSETYTAPLPSFSLHEMLSPHWSAYAQIARGFLAPNLNYFYVANPDQNQVSPENTWNYQIGTSWQTHRLSLGVDGYYIDFSNLVGSRQIGQNTAYFNLGSAHYYGVEAEASLALSHGFSAFANGSWNEARQTSNNQRIANAPDATFAVGAIYENRNFYASLIDKYVGARYGESGQTRGLDPFSQLDMNLAYTIHRHGAGNGTKFKLNIGNLLGRHEINAFAGYAADGRTPLYYTQAGRSFFGSVAIPFQL